MKKVLFIIAVIGCLMIINNLVRSIYSIWQKNSLATDAERELNYQKQEYERLKSELSYVRTQEFIEREAREKLFMGKSKESIVLGAQNQGPENLSNNRGDNKPNWKKWWELFF